MPQVIAANPQQYLLANMIRIRLIDEYEANIEKGDMIMSVKTVEQMQSMINGSRNNAELGERQVIALETIAEALVAIVAAMKDRHGNAE